MKEYIRWNFWHWFCSSLMVQHEVIYVVLNTIEAEYMASSQTTCQVIQMRKILKGLFGQMADSIVIYYDNQSFIKLTKNLVFHNCFEHTDIWYHHLQDCVCRLIMLLQYIPTVDQNDNILKMALSRGKFEFHKCRIRVVEKCSMKFSI